MGLKALEQKLGCISKVIENLIELNSFDQSMRNSFHALSSSTTGVVSEAPDKTLMTSRVMKGNVIMHRRNARNNDIKLKTISGFESASQPNLHVDGSVQQLKHFD